MSPLLRSGLATSQDMICSHSPSKGSFWMRHQPRTRFLLPCSWYKVCSTAAGSDALLKDRNIPAVQRSMEKTRMGIECVLGTKGEQLTAQRNTACCNCSSC